jgi:hypothetical protein
MRISEMRRQIACRLGLLPRKGCTDEELMLLMQEKFDYAKEDGRRGWERTKTLEARIDWLNKQLDIATKHADEVARVAVNFRVADSEFRVAICNFDIARKKTDTCDAE